VYSQLKDVDHQRQGQNYINTDTSMAVHGQTGKKHLMIKSTFVMSFQSNQAKEVARKHGLLSCGTYLRFPICGKIHQQGHHHFFGQN
jgi:hypothetical protein